MEQLPNKRKNRSIIFWERINMGCGYDITKIWQVTPPKDKTEKRKDAKPNKQKNKKAKGN